MLYKRFDSTLFSRLVAVLACLLMSPSSLWTRSRHVYRARRGWLNLADFVASMRGFHRWLLGPFQGVRDGNDHTIRREGYFNSLAHGRSGCDFKNEIFNLVLLIGIFRSSHDNAFRWMPWDLTDDKSTLVQVMAWCRQAASHYLSKCWPRSLLPYDITKPQ